ncbi:MAG: GntR family transcriptional regulator [Brooklawnia sp.]
MSLPGVNRLTLREQVWTNLRTAILNGELAPGTRLAEIDLAEQLGVSRGTVREALRYLQQSGLVAGENRTGLYVTEMEPGEVYELFEVRAALEGLAADLIVRSGRAVEVADELEDLLPEVPEGAPYGERLDADLGFHEALCAAAGNSMLLRQWSELKDLMRVAVLADSVGENSSLMEADYHRPIVEALRSEDPEKARRALVDHMSDAAHHWARKARMGEHAER